MFERLGKAIDDTLKFVVIIAATIAVILWATWDYVQFHWKNRK